MLVERTAFVGRTAELALLHAAVAGDARTVVIDGPEGIGKTALVRRLVDGEATERGCRVLAVAGEEGERGLVLGLLRELAVEAGRRLAPVRWPPADLPGPERVTAAVQAVRDALAAASAGGPVVLVVDDAQWPRHGGAASPLSPRMWPSRWPGSTSLRATPARLSAEPATRSPSPSRARWPARTTSWPWRVTEAFAVPGRMAVAVVATSCAVSRWMPVAWVVPGFVVPSRTGVGVMSGAEG